MTHKSYLGRVVLLGPIWFKFDVRNVADSFLIEDEIIQEDPAEAYFINQISQENFTETDLQKAFMNQA